MTLTLARAERRRVAALLALAAAAACAPHLSVEPQTLAGSYRGETADGQEVVLTFSEAEESFRGAGSIGGEPVVVAGAVGWRGTGSLASADGANELVEMTLSADGERVTLERQGQGPVTLHRGEAAGPPAPSGPFAGRYRAVRDRAPFAEVTLVQSGELIAGAGIVTGDPGGVSGRVTAADRAEGVVTFLDGSQVSFAADRAADGSLTVHGFGEPMAMPRRPAS